MEISFNRPCKIVINDFVLIDTVKTEVCSCQYTLDSIYLKVSQHAYFFFFDGLTQNKVYQISCVIRIQTCNSTTVSRSFIKK